jgi:hypothetical protein
MATATASVVLLNIFISRLIVGHNAVALSHERLPLVFIPGG